MGGRLTRRDFLQAAAAAGIGLAGLDCERPARAGKPNVVFIMADDLGYECLGCNGGTSYATPEIDALAEGGLRFTRAFTTPLCTPSRVQLMSGQYPFRNGWSGGLWDAPQPHVVPPDLIDIGRRMRQAGYATAVAGKWQLCNFKKNPDHVTRTGFDEHCVWTWDYLTIGFGGGRPPRYWAPGIWHNGRLDRSFQKPDVFGPDVYTDFLIDFMRRHRDRPFFAYYPMALPHVPVVATPDDREEFERRGAGDWAFAAMVEYMDELVGRIVDAIDDLDLRQDTLVIFTSDNGTDSSFTSMLDGRPVRGGKETMTAAGGHVPLVASWPGTTPAGRVCDDLTDSTDFLPTLLEIAGAPPPTGRVFDGRSIAPQLRGLPGDAREWVHLQLYESRAIRGTRWKLFNDGRLFDLANDPYEERPIAPGAGNEDAQAARATLQGVFERLT